MPIWPLATVSFLAVAVLAFGSVYSWARMPLVAGAVVLGAIGIWIGRSRARPPVALTIALVIIALAIGVQLLPLSQAALRGISPNAIPIITQRDLQFALGASLSHPISIAPSETQFAIGYFIGFAVLLIGTSMALGRRTAKHLCAWLVVLGAALSLVAIIQQATVTNGKIFGFWELVQGGAPFGPFVNKNHFAGWMLMVIPVAFGYCFAEISKGLPEGKRSARDLLLWFSTPRANRIALGCFATLIMVLALVMTLSRSGIVALSIALMAAGTVVIRRQKGLTQRYLPITFLIFVGLAVVMWVGTDRLATRFSNLQMSDVNQRPAIWSDTLRITRDFWLTGSGANTYGISMLFYKTSAPGLHVREAHNDYLQLSAEGGLLVGIPVLAAAWLLARDAWRRFHESTGSAWWIRLGAITALFAIALQSIVEFSLQMPANAALFSVLAGLAIHDGRRL